MDERIPTKRSPDMAAEGIAFQSCFPPKNKTGAKKIVA